MQHRNGVLTSGEPALSAMFHDAARWIQVRMGGTVMLAPEQPIQLRS